VAECACGNKAAAEARLLRLLELLPGLRLDGLTGLFDIFPPPLRNRAMAALRGAGLIPAIAQVTGSLRRRASEVITVDVRLPILTAHSTDVAAQPGLTHSGSPGL
jgi:hypothetical protein